MINFVLLSHMLPVIHVLLFCASKYSRTTVLTAAELHMLRGPRKHNLQRFIVVFHTSDRLEFSEVSDGFINHQMKYKIPSTFSVQHPSHAWHFKIIEFKQLHMFY